MKKINKMRSKNHKHPEKHTGILISRVREIFEDAIHEFCPNFDLIAFRQKGLFFTGYFLDPFDFKYIHIWKFCVSPDLKVIHSDTLREAALIPTDGFKFRHNVFITMAPSKLQNIGLYIPTDRLGFIFPLSGEPKEII